MEPRHDALMFSDVKGTITVWEQHCLSTWTLFNNSDLEIGTFEFDSSEQIFYFSDTNRKVISRYELIGWKEGLKFMDDVVTERIEREYFTDRCKSTFIFLEICSVITVASHW